MRVVIVLTVLACACAAWAGAERVRAAGGPSRGWIAIEEVYTGKDAKGDDVERRRAALYHVPGEAAAGTIDPVAEVRALPEAMAVWGDSLVYAMPADVDGAEGLLPVRVLRVEPIPGGRFRYHAPTPVEPLPTTGRVAGLAVIGGGPAALVRETVDRGAAQRLLVLDGGAWRAVALPQFLDPSSEARLVGMGDRAVVVEQTAVDGARVWHARVRVGGDIEAAPEWVLDDIDPPPADVIEVLSCDDQLVVARETGAGVVSLALARERYLLEVGMVRVGAGAALMGVGRRVVGVWSETGVAAVPSADSGAAGASARPGSGDVRTAGRQIHMVVSNLDGTLEYKGLARTTPPIAPGEVQVLALALGSAFLSVLVFVVRPASKWSGPVKLPEGTALAEPTRRMAAFSIDMLPGVVASWALFGPEATVAETGALPLLVIALVAVAHTAIGEAVWGRTFGKALTMCRTVAIDGGKVEPAQAVLHAATRVLCPALGVFIVLRPWEPGPSSFGTVVVVDGSGSAKAREGEP